MPVTQHNYSVSNRNRLLIILFFIAGITIAHYTMSHTVIYLHDISRRLYYLPIILSGLWFGKRGGIYSSMAITILYFPHALFSWYGNNPRYLDNIIEIIFFNIVGYLVGVYIERRNIQQQQNEENARKLESAYRQLKTNSERLTQLEERLRFADRLSILGELAASLAHEIRNPLGGIQGAAEILRKKIDSHSTEAEFVDIQLKEIQRLNKVVENYLSLAKTDSVDFTPTPLHEIVTDALELTRISARKKKILLETHFPEQSVVVLANGLQIQQVILNLALNAIQAMPDGGKLDISISTENTTALLIIADNGPGIPEEYKDRLFKTFFTSKKEGTGLGLSIVKRIVQNHNGKVWFESDESGTEFFVQLPLADK